jgi:Flp pilus assembly protein TadD
VQLIDGREDRHIWVESFDRDFKQLLSLQREIAREVAIAIDIQLTRQEQDHLAATVRADPGALDAYIAGVSLLGQADDLAAIEQFERAVQEDPNFAQAYAMLANAYLRAGSGWTDLPREGALQNALNAARKALALDDSLGVAHVVLGVIAMQEWEWDQADKTLRRSYDLAPNNPLIMSNLAEYLSLTGKNDEAIALSERAVAAAPNELGLRHNLGTQLYIGRQYDRVFEEAKRIRELFPSSRSSELLTYFAHGALGNREEAIRAFISAMKPGGANSDLVAIGEHALRTEGADSAIRAIAEAASDRAIEHGDAAFEVGIEALEFGYLFGLIGDVDSMFDWFERSYQLRESDLIWISVDPSLDAYRSDPRFVDLLRRMNYPGA